MKKVGLIILDGWGHGKHDNSNAIYTGHTPFVDSLYDAYPNAQLLTDGENVGLPEGQMGNSEVGHLNIGAGRIVYQDLVRINKAIETGELAGNKTLIQAFDTALDRGSRIHLMGLVSNGGVHSSQEHLHELMSLAHAHGIENIFVHAFTDGRDCDPKSGAGFVRRLVDHARGTGSTVASVVGRYYAMDRDKRWERIALAYNLLVNGEGHQTHDVVAAIEDSYGVNVTDEFITPIVTVNGAGEPVGRIQENDVVVCFNFRTDRCREITMALTQQDFSDFNMNTLPLHYVTMTEYDKTFEGVQVLFRKDNLPMTLGETLEQAGQTQIRIAETEKYPHVTFFFSGGREERFQGEKRILVPSPKVATYDLQPEMSAPTVTAEIIDEINKPISPDFICLNYANPDMVGHTGVFEAVMKAVNCVDDCLRQVIEVGLARDYAFLVIADHGNADKVVNEDGSPNTAHTTNPVPVFLIGHDAEIKDGILADVAPTILKIMGIDQPAEMTGKSLV